MQLSTLLESARATALGLVLLCLYGGFSRPALAWQDGGTTPEDDRRERVIEAIRTGDLAKARELLDELWVDERRLAAETALAEGRALEAAEAIDEALEVDSIDRTKRGALLLLRGRGLYAAASSDPATRGHLFAEAKASFEEAARSGGGVSAALRASRAARMAGQSDEALTLARQSAQWIDAEEGRAEGLDVEQPYLRTLAEAAFGKYVEVVSAAEGAAADERATLFDETRIALERMVGDHPTDPWAYGQLANLYTWEGRSDESIDALEAGIAVLPNDQELHTALVRKIGDKAQARAIENGLVGQDVLDARYRAVVDRYAKFSAAHPENPLGYWYRGFEKFYQAVGRLNRGEDSREMFTDAESLFAMCAERGPEYAPACRDYEILARLGVGWSQVNAGEMDAAVATFLGMDALRPLGSTDRTAALDLALTAPDSNGGTVTQLPSAVGGIDYVTRQLVANPSDRTALTRAAEIADAIFALRPDDPNFANNVGFLNRDAAMLWEMDASQRFTRAETDEQKAVAQESRDKAQELIERSWNGYVRASELAPNDVRVVNDTGLVMVYYLRTDPDLSETYFRRAIKDGEVQLQDESMDEATREALNEAWGDAHENMGILEWTVRRNPKKAREWFAQALEIGPPSRFWMKRQLMPLLEEWIETGEEPEALGELERRRVWTHNP